MMNMKEKVNGSEERSSQFKKQVNGSTGEEALLLHLATTPGQEIDEEILTNETWKGVKSISSDKVIAKLLTQVQQLQGKVIQLTEERSFGVHKLLESKMIKVAGERLTFNENDVHGSILYWNNFFNLYNVKSDLEKFYAIEQILPERVWKAMNYCSDIKLSYTWLISYLKTRYDPVYQCHNMRNRKADEFSSIEELEDIAMEAAKCPQEQLIKHFMLESLSEDQRKKMEMYLLLPMKEFKFQLKLLLQSIRKPCQITAVKKNMKSENPQIVQDKIGQINEPKISRNQGLNVSRISYSKALQNGTHVTPNKRHSGMFCCVVCGNKWVSRSLFCHDSRDLDCLKMQCFNCNNSVLPQHVKALKFQSLHDIDSKDCGFNKFLNENVGEETSKYFVETRNCFQCGRQGHLARSCAAVVMHQGVRNGESGSQCIGKYKRGYPRGINGRLD